jgi:hypothetical protein
MTFDRLIYIDRLKEAGVSEPVARAHAEALRDALLETVATKADVQAVRSEIQALAVEVRTIEAKLDRKIEITARDLTIRGAGGLIVIATLMIGLKLFG